MNDLFIKVFTGQINYIKSKYDLDEALLLKAATEIKSSATLDNSIELLKKRLNIMSIRWKNKRDKKHALLYFLNKPDSSLIAFSIAFDIIESFDKRFISGYIPEL